MYIDWISVFVVCNAYIGTGSCRLGVDHLEGRGQWLTTLCDYINIIEYCCPPTSSFVCVILCND